MSRLLLLLGGSDSEAGTDSDEDVFDLDVLLDNVPCQRFLLRCVKNELPSNLINCLRLLRVLQLQHAHSVSTQQSDPGPVSTLATAKVAMLLCLLCSDPSVGEQLCPHAKAKCRFSTLEKEKLTKWRKPKSIAQTQLEP
eukprot:1545984-Ditylum_brightwellii.AAC.1